MPTSSAAQHRQWRFLLHRLCLQFYYVLNQQNGNPGTITVKGGTFVNYDPSKGDDNLGGNFVADGYKVVTETHGTDTWYTVVAK